MNPSAAILHHIDSVLDALEKRPKLYGSSLETVEFTALSLLESRAIATGDNRFAERPVALQWSRFLRGRGMDVGNGYLFSLYESGRTPRSTAFAELAKHLAHFRKSLFGAHPTKATAEPEPADPPAALSREPTEPARALLDLLDDENLTLVADHLGLVVPEKATTEQLRIALAEYAPASVHAILAVLSKDLLRDLCRRLSVDAEGKGKQPYVQKLAGHFLAVSSGRRVVEVELSPRKPRLAWIGMDEKEIAVSVPTQVLEIVRPGRVLDRGDRKGAAGELPSIDAIKTTSSRPEPMPNRLIWTNDNLVALQTLLDDRDPSTGEHRYRGKVDLVYIDPPFMVNSDFRADNTIHVDIDEEAGIEAVKEPSLVEFIAYRDTWRNGLDSFLAMLRRRLELLKDLLSPTGSIYVHLDWHAVHYVKVLMDEVFGYENFQSEIIWKRTSARAGSKAINHIHDTLISFGIRPGNYCQAVKLPYDPEYIRSHYRHVDERGRYRLVPLNAPGTSNGPTGEPWRGYTPPKGRHWSHLPEQLDAWAEQGLVQFPTKGKNPELKQYLEDKGGIEANSVWTDVSAINAQGLERLGYPTQKPIELLQRIISASCPPGGLVLDCFMGSGTTIEAAERLGRRWIGIDNSKYAVHVARKRLIQLQGKPKEYEKPQYDYVECDECHNIERKEKRTRSNERYDVRPFSVENMGVYQRAGEWQDFQRERNTYRDEMVKVFGGEVVDVHPLLHGKKGASWVHIGPLEAPVSIAQVWSIAEAAANTKIHHVTILSADYDAVAANKKEIEDRLGVQVTIRIIPSSAIDEVKRRIEQRRSTKETIIETTAIPAFYAPLSITLAAKVTGRTVKLTLERCDVDIESFVASQRPIGATTKERPSAREKREIDRWKKREKELNHWLSRAKTWQRFVDFWAVDWNYGERLGSDDKPIFENDWQSFRDRNARAGQGDIVFVAETQYEKPSRYQIAAKVTDVFGNDGVATVEVFVK